MTDTRVLTFTAVCAVVACLCGGVFSADPEENMDAMQIIRYHGYPAEAHWATTEDGYILGLQRIPYGRNQTEGGDRPVVFLQHGLLACSTNWITNLPNESFAFLLADAGFDVWLGNVRGNTYSRNHTTLNPDKDSAYWEFSWDEMAHFDLVAMINKALAVSGQQDLYYAGHSQGTMMGFSGFAINQTLARKVKAFYALAPVTTVGHIKGGLKVLSYAYKEIAFLFKVFGVNDFLPSSTLVRLLAEDYCGKEIDKAVCGNILFVIAGFDKAGLNESRLPVYLTHTPSGTSVQNIVHFSQMIHSNLFQMYDYGTAEKNKEHYGQPTPPLYPLESLSVPVTLFTGGQDWLADPIDVAALKPRLKTLVKSVGIASFEHLDFIWGIQAADLVYKPIISMIKKDL